MPEPSIIERSVEKAHIWLSAAAEVLRRHVSAGEIDDVRAQLPEDLLPILG